MFCTKCGAQNADGAKFCTTCGAPLGNSETAATSQPSAEASQSPIEGDKTSVQTISYDVSSPSNASASSSQTSGSQEPPQSWPDESDSHQSSNGKKSKKTAIIVAIVIVVLVLIATVVGLTMAGIISFGDNTTEEAAVEESATSDDASEKSKDEEKESSKKRSSSDSYLEADFYDCDPEELQSSFEDLGFELSDVSAVGPSDGSNDNPGTLFATFTGEAAEDLPGLKGDEIEITVGINLTDDEQFSYDSYGLADNPVDSLDELSDKCTVSNVVFAYESDVSKDEFVSIMSDIIDTCSFDKPSYASASDDELLDEAVDEFKLSSENAHIESSYVGDVLYLSGSDWSISIMGGDELGGTFVDFDLYM